MSSMTYLWRKIVAACRTVKLKAAVKQILGAEREAASKQEDTLEQFSAHRLHRFPDPSPLAIAPSSGGMKLFQSFNLH